MSNVLSGWYYDLQTDHEGPGRLTCVTLHPNTIDTGTKDWADAIDDPDNPAYRKDPICVALVNEDFQVSVANSWSDFGGDMLGQMWEQVKPLAPYAEFAQEMIHKAVQDYNDPKNAAARDKINESKVSRALASVMSNIDQKIQSKEVDIAEYLNRSLVVQGTRFSYYSGTGISFGNMVMKFTMFPKWNGASLKTVTEQTEEIYPYIVGHFLKEDGLHADMDGMIGWQLPPAGFKADIKNVDNIQKGTLLLKYGAYYAIENLVIENASFNFSRQMVKHPNQKGQFSPLYCDITLQLKPATKFSDEKLKKFVSGAGMAVSREKLTRAMAGAV